MLIVNKLITFSIKACVYISYMVYSNSGQENTVDLVESQANEYRLRKKLEKKSLQSWFGSDMIQELLKRTNFGSKRKV